jgi:hypothetical protein
MTPQILTLYLIKSDPIPQNCLLVTDLRYYYMKSGTVKIKLLEIIVHQLVPVVASK